MRTIEVGDIAEVCKSCGIWPDAVVDVRNRAKADGWRLDDGGQFVPPDGVSMEFVEWVTALHAEAPHLFTIENIPDAGGVH